LVQLRTDRRSAIDVILANVGRKSEALWRTKCSWFVHGVSLPPRQVDPLGEGAVTAMTFATLLSMFKYFEFNVYRSYIEFEVEVRRLGSTSPCILCGEVLRIRSTLKSQFILLTNHPKSHAKNV
jgi:hypothetical protein